MSAAVPIAVALSTLLIAVLAQGDAKRRRALRLPAATTGPWHRRLLALAALLPGAALAASGQGAGFIIWLGAVASTGWLLTNLLARPRSTG